MAETNSSRSSLAEAASAQGYPYKCRVIGPTKIKYRIRCLLLCICLNNVLTVAAAPQYPDLTEGRKLLKAQQYEAAVSCFNRAIERNKGRAGAYYERATCYLHLNKYQDAVNDCTAAIALKPGTKEYFSCRAFAYMQLKLYRKGIADYKSVLSYDHDNKEAKDNIAAARRFIADEPKIPSSVTDVDTREWYAKVADYKLRGDLAGALRTCDQALKSVTDQPILYFLRAKTLLDFERYDDAVKDFDKGIAMDPKNASKIFVDAYYWRAVAFANQKKYQQALKGFDQVMKIDPKNHDSHKRKGDIYAAMNQPQKALEEYEPFLKAKPYEEDVKLKRADMYAKLKRYDIALPYYEQMVKKFPEDDAGRQRRGTAYFMLGQYQKAIDDLNVAIDEDPENAQSLYRMRGEAYDKIGKHDLAALDFKHSSDSEHKRMK